MRVFLLMGWAIFMHYASKWWGKKSREYSVNAALAFALDIAVLILGFQLIFLFTRTVV